MLRTALILFFFGAIFGTLGDYTHVVSQTLGYPDPLFPLPGGQPIWVPFLFGGAVLGIGWTHTWADRSLFVKQPVPKSLGLVLLGTLFFMISYGISGFLPLEPQGLRDGILASLTVIVWALFDGSWQGILMALCTAFVGTAVELSLTHIGAFFYGPHVANLGGVPSWLPWLYTSASIAVANLARYLKETDNFRVMNKRCGFLRSPEASGKDHQIQHC